MLMYFTEKLADRVPPVPSMVYNLEPDFPCLEVSNYREGLPQQAPGWSGGFFPGSPVLALL